MKQILLMLAAALVLTSCIRKQVVLDMTQQRDSLTTVVVAKDSLINTVFEEINAISENLAQIRTRENLITKVEESEGGVRPTDRINASIEAIDRLLAENRARIASLQRKAEQLRQANLRITALEQTIANLNGELAEKQAQIEALRSELEQRDAEVAQLAEQVARQQTAIDEHEAHAEQLAGEKVELESRLNTVYYIVGAEKELLDAQIISKQGFIGRTLTAGDAAHLESFTEADSRLLTEIPIGKRRVTVVTPHPEESYELIVDADKRVLKIAITDTERFWATSKILIVSYK